MEHSVPPIKSTDVWFADGNLVLQAENTLFKVYEGLLTRESPFFRDMFSLPQPDASTSGDTYDGCRLVKVYDSVSHMRIFLSAIFFYG